MEYNYDLIIVGGGPAGSTMALSASKHGLKVLLLDKEYFPRDKICGDGILSGCMPILEEFQLTDKLLQEPHAWTSTCQIFTEHESLQVPSHPQEVLVSKRQIFDNVLFQAAKSCVDAREGAKVENLLVRDGQVFGVQGTFQTGKSFEYTAKVVAGADGCGSIVAKKLGLYKFEAQHGAVATRAYYRHLPVVGNELELYYFQECLPGYFWIFPVDRETVNVGVCANFRKNKGISLPALHRQLTQHPLLEKRFEKAELVGNIQAWYLPLASVRRTMHGNGFILAGDAAGLIDPLWGDGIDTAMISGKIAGEILAEVCRGSNYSAETLQKYAHAVWNRLGSQFKFNNMFRQRWESPPFSFPFLTRLEMFNKFYFQGTGKVKHLTLASN